MPLELPPSCHLRIRDESGVWRITIPPFRRPPVILGPIALFGGWALIAWSSWPQLEAAAGAPATRSWFWLWIGTKIVLGVVVMAILFWTVAGHEVLVLRTDALVHRREMWGLKLERAYDLSHIANLHQVPLTTAGSEIPLRRDPWRIGGRIAFQYKGRTVRCAAGLDDAEANLIVEQLRARNPRLIARHAA